MIVEQVKDRSKGAVRKLGQVGCKNCVALWYLGRCQGASLGRPPWYSMIRSTETMLFSIMLVCRIRKLKFIVTLAEKLLGVPRRNK